MSVRTRPEGELPRVLAAQERPTVEVVPAALRADLDHVAGELVVLFPELREFAGTRDAAAVGVLQLVAVDVLHVPEILPAAHGAVLGDRLPHVAGGPQELGVGVAHVEPRDTTSSEVPEDGPPGQGVVNVASHDGQPTGVPGGERPHPRRWSGAGQNLTRYIESIYRAYHTAPERRRGWEIHVLELAVLGLLKEQPLHGYELKKRLGETLGFLWGVSYGSLYPALARLEKAGAIEVVDPDLVRDAAPVPATGSLKGEAAAARRRRTSKPTRRTRKAYRITERGNALFAELLVADETSGTDEERSFALKLAFCRYLPSDARIELLQRRRATLAERLVSNRRALAPRDASQPATDLYTRSLIEHRTETTVRDLEWVDNLIDAERRQSPPEGATA